MAKTVRLEPIAQETSVETNGNLLSVLINKDLDVLRECGGRGMCATCHVYVTEGMNQLSPINRREQRTLEVITTCRPNSRLACQARVQGNGVTVELPAGMYINSLQDIEVLIGRRAEQNLLHPITGQVLVEEGKLITRSMMKQLEATPTFRVSEYFSNSSEA
ncbi:MULTISPECIES: 2Fe-2S iron-sulfur cluster-binding protein [Cyanophyceae]|jgi:ferredoxin|uniref:2Fe-2S iron-sulfur cluster binding domain-containing protein n=2 Tax=Thermoleptolyngbya TaxID=2303528 RepID=A0A6M8B3P9_9CYAN|nr:MULTISPECIES: 2Fe-2S iron-sulfur cluster-binding protein [Cyanophyceae]WOB42479.1 2Fe-2S iron-sulfur cluster binding domain-containing protein [Thermoleptolyngbya oregonensis NK1-22]MBF2084621.1 2Fe-2S iron-sulfur cluster binding domain-containing protein [Thermoleptolyngbya sp. C42_A2020_037]MDG2615380.1 2Fe-2S iron-sulfur cluster-binding protein [Thermoleptolyngbya sichuanensis XZ-Cy5]QKD81018.1 2Fe-2S iron-sulfur cluster binding domain-containing protein [Thermoleptolyngbya sichuanensis A